MRKLDLTSDLVALVWREVQDPGPDEDLREPSDEEYEAVAAKLVEAFGSSPIWVFAYGSLIWRPDFDHVESTPGRVYGWRRKYCLRDVRWRGSAEHPGFMLALDRGGSCNGVVYRLPEGDRHAQMLRLLFREVAYEGDFDCMRILDVKAADGRVVRAFTSWIMPRSDPDYLLLPVAEQARLLARAVGFLGSAAEYLHNTVSHLSAAGIDDPYLWHLQRLVAAEISAEYLPVRPASER